MNKETLAGYLNGNHYGGETSPGMEKIAKDNNLVIVFAYSDDNMELRGAIDDECSCYDGGSFNIGTMPNGTGAVAPQFQDGDEEVLRHTS